MQRRKEEKKNVSFIAENKCEYFHCGAIGQYYLIMTDDKGDFSHFFGMKARFSCNKKMCMSEVRVK